MLSRKVEDYLEAILNVIGEKGYARIKDISKEMGVRPPSVVEMARKLDKKGFIRYRKYDGITFTRKGVQIAKTIKDRHETLKDFLELLDIPPEIADKDACTIEHHLDPITIVQLKRFVSFLKRSPEDPKWLKHFKAYSKMGFDGTRKKR